MLPERREATFVDVTGERVRRAPVLPDPHLELFHGPAGAEGLEAELASVGERLGMGLVLLGHVNGERYTVVALHRREPRYALEPGDVIPIGETYCRQEITADKAFVLGNAALDPRFASHPGYLKYGLIAYVGAPITLPDGTVFGTLCAVDAEPKVPRLDAVEHLVATSERLGRLVALRLRESRARRAALGD